MLSDANLPLFDLMLSDANLPLFANFADFTQKSHFCEWSKSVEIIYGDMRGGWRCAMHIKVVYMKLIDNLKWLFLL